MSFLIMFIKAIPYLMPFIKEMLIGKRTWRQAFRDNRGKASIAIVVIISLIFNLVLMVKVGNLAFGYLELSRAKQELEAKYQVLEKNKCVVEGSNKHPIESSKEVKTEVKQEVKPIPVAKRHHAVKPEAILAAEVNSDLERIRKRETGDR